MIDWLPNEEKQQHGDEIDGCCMPTNQEDRFAPAGGSKQFIVHIMQASFWAPTMLQPTDTVSCDKRWSFWLCTMRKNEPSKTVHLHKRCLIKLKREYKLKKPEAVCCDWGLFSPCANETKSQYWWALLGKRRRVPLQERNTKQQKLILLNSNCGTSSVTHTRSETVVV